MDNQIIFILVIAVVALCSLIFFSKVKINLNKRGVNIEGSEPKKTANVKKSKRVQITQTGSSESNIEGSEDIIINND